MTLPVNRGQSNNGFSNIESVLVADCGSNITRVALVEVVDQAYRFVARGEAPSTLEAPFGDVTIGVINAIGAIEASTGRRLLLGGKLIVPQQEDGSGVDAFVASSSAAEPLRVVAAGLVGGLSAASAARASHATYTDVLDTMSLDDYGDAQEGEPLAGGVQYDPEDPEAEFSPFAGRKDRPEIFPPDPNAPIPSRKEKNKNGPRLFSDNPRRFWKERQVAKLRRLAPNVIVMSGGSDGAPVDSLLRLVDVILEANRQESVLALATGENRRPTTFIFAGNRGAQDKIVEKVGGQIEVFMVDNIRPTAEVENLLPLQRQLSALYQERLLPGLPGYRRLNELSTVPVNTTCNSVGLITQFLARDVTANRVLTVDLGGANSALFYASATDYASMVRGGFGLSFGLSNVLAETNPEDIRRWLPFEASEDELIHYALNKTLRPHILPATERELFIEGAFAREALRHLMEELKRESTTGYDYNRLIGAGGPLVNAPLWQAALLLLDGLQPPGAADTGLVEMDLDSTMLMAAAGTLAALNPNAAAYLFRYDCLHRYGPVVVVHGDGQLGSLAATVTMRRSDGRVREAQVTYGSIALLPLRSDEKASLEINLGSAFRIGNSERGAVVSTTPGREIVGGALGLIIDARGRPIKFASDPKARMEQVAGWYNVYRNALQQAEEEGSNDFATTSGPSQPQQPAAALVPNGSSSSSNEPVEAEQKPARRGLSLGRKK
ncbi:MAG TPA: glutamate mutase L [Chloroflexia bacterium]|nr:glutamate mutase L [Chloroflexia bacterium]